MVATSTLLLFSLLLPSLTIYILFLAGLFRFRRKYPFNSIFFKLFFAIGVIDIIRLIEDWFLFKFALLGWFWMDKVVMMTPVFFAKLHNIFSWYFAHAQVFGTLILAVNRLSVCAFMKDWTNNDFRISLIYMLGLPLLTNIPLWTLSFYFSRNGTDGSVLLYWNNTNWQFYYLSSCAVLCSGAAVSCAVLYGIIVIKVRKRRAETRARVSKRENNKNNEELKLVVLGVALSALAACCGTVCAMMGIYPEALDTILPYFNLVNDMWCWVNPYLLFICSKPVKKHMKAFFCFKNKVNPIVVARVDKSNKVSIEAEMKNVQSDM